MKKVNPDKWEIIFSIIKTFMRLKSYYCDPEKCTYRCTREQKTKCHAYYQRLANDIVSSLSED